MSRRTESFDPEAGGGTGPLVGAPPAAGQPGEELLAVVRPFD